MTEKESSEDLILAAIQNAKDKGIKIVRQVVFDWCDPVELYKERELPYACNVSGAILIMLGKEQEFRTSFPARKWLEEIHAYLGVSDYWFWKFYRGWAYSSEIFVTTVDDKKKEKTVKDKVSKAANKMAQQLVDK